MDWSHPVISCQQLWQQLTVHACLTPNLLFTDEVFELSFLTIPHFKQKTCTSVISWGKLAFAHPGTVTKQLRRESLLSQTQGNIILVNTNTLWPSFAYWQCWVRMNCVVDCRQHWNLSKWLTTFRLFRYCSTTSHTRKIQRLMWPLNGTEHWLWYNTWHI